LVLRSETYSFIDSDFSGNYDITKRRQSHPSEKPGPKYRLLPNLASPAELNSKPNLLQERNIWIKHTRISNA
jgi:hypothetical protein